MVIIALVCLLCLHCHAAVPDTFHFSGWGSKQILRKACPLRAAEHAAQLLAQHLPKSSTWCMLGAPGAWRRKRHLTLCSSTLAHLPDWKPKGHDGGASSSARERDRLSQRWRQPCCTVLLLISVGVGCAFLKGKFTSSLISMISHRFAGSRSRSPPASVSTLLAQLVMGPHVMQPWSQDAITDEFLLCLPHWLSITAGTNHSHIAGGERYSEL